MGPMGSEECITEGITENCQVWYSMGPMGSEECITEGSYNRSQAWWKRSTVGKLYLLAQPEPYGVSDDNIMLKTSRLQGR